jgi:hypothetical protein
MKSIVGAAAGVLLCSGILDPASAGTPPSVTGSVVLLQPGTNVYEGVLLERCVGEKATIRVVLATPITIDPLNALTVFAEGSHTPAIHVASKGDLPEISAFEGGSAIGCIEPGTRLVLALSIGGTVGGLDIVLGSGEVKNEPLH